jgi:ATP-dependent Clp protease ATP-binding subunit ClpA
MFERYTKRARRTLFFARYEAGRLGGTSIDTEHLLLAVLREGRGTLSRILARSRISLTAVRADLEGRLRQRQKVALSVEIPFSGEAERVLQFAAQEADQLLHDYIGTEHLLLGLLREEGSVAASILTSHGVRLDDMRREIAKSRDDRLAVAVFLVPVADLLERIDSVRLLVAELARAPSGSDEARNLVERVHQELDALKREVREWDDKEE